jgi:hypothetical protein
MNSRVGSKIVRWRCASSALVAAFPAGVPYAEIARDRGECRLGGRNGRERQESNAAGELVCEIATDFDSQPGLAASSWPGERHEPLHSRKLRRAADQRITGHRNGSPGPVANRQLAQARGECGHPRQRREAERRDIAALRQDDLHRVLAALTVVILQQLRAEPSGLHANDGIDSRIERGPAVEDFNAERVFLQLVVVFLQGALDDVLQEPAQDGRICERSAAEKAGQRGADRLGSHIGVAFVDAALRFVLHAGLGFAAAVDGAAFTVKSPPVTSATLVHEGECPQVEHASGSAAEACSRLTDKRLCWLATAAHPGTKGHVCGSRPAQRKTSHGGLHDESGPWNGGMWIVPGRRRM